MLELLKRTYQEWSRDNCMRLGAALAYYTVFSMAPLLVLVISIAALAFGERAAEGQLMAQLEGMLGPEGAQGVQGMIESASEPRNGWIATIVGLVTMVIGASTVFGELQADLNLVWNVPQDRKWGWFDYVKTRLASFSMILVIGFLLMVSLVLSAAVTALGSYVSGIFPGADVLLRVIEFSLSFGVTTLLFAMLFKLMPDTDILWSDVWLGAAVTALLFVVGKFAIGLYLGGSGAATVYGAAGSLALVLLWVYYSSQLLFFGAEFTQVWTRTHGSRRDTVD